MERLKQQIRQFAESAGADDVRFADAGDFERAIPGGVASPRALLPGAKSILVLFAQYLPAAKTPPGAMALSAYYAASHRAYTAAQKTQQFIRGRGAGAVLTSLLPSRAAALRTGGFIGGNHFYYHPQFGSFVSIKTIVTDAAEPDPPARRQEPQAHCLSCNACRRACPSDAVDDLRRCLRQHILGQLPENLRGDVYQLIGCEKCQAACPLNRQERSEPISFALPELLSGLHLDALRALAGPNMIRRQRVRGQAALFAANTGAAHLIPRLMEMAETDPPPANEYARWAADQLQEHRSL